MLRLKKALYRLKQAPRAWNYKFDNTLNSKGFKKVFSDQAMYISSINEHRLLVGVYMDDLIITGPSIEEIELFKSSIKTQFDMTDFGLLNSLLGIKVI